MDIIKLSKLIDAIKQSNELIKKGDTKGATKILKEFEYGFKVKVPKYCFLHKDNLSIN